MDEILKKIVLLFRTNRFEEALERLLELAIDYPTEPTVHNLIGAAFLKLNKLNDAEKYFLKSINLNSNFIDPYLNLGMLYESEKSLKKCTNIYLKALDINPASEKALSNLARIYHINFQYYNALELDLKLLELNSNFPNINNRIGVNYHYIGNHRNAIEFLRKDLEINQKAMQVHSNLVMYMTYCNEFNNDLYYQELKNFSNKLNNQLISKPSFQEIYSWDEPLNVGFVSGDFRDHPVGSLLDSFLASFKTKRFRKFAFSNNKKVTDRTVRLRQNFDEWYDISLSADKDVYELIKHLNIHILIDLSGHTDFNRLPLFSLRPSPIQVSWIGYWASTGLSQMDYFISDNYLTPPNTTEKFSEKIIRMPSTRWCYTPHYDFELSPLPCKENKYITYGCFNSYPKITEEIVYAWSQILKSVKNSKLFLMSKQFADTRIQDNLIQRFRDFGISDGRLIIKGPDTKANYMKCYSKVDIVLDTFPFTGGLTTLESLWMGVPVITLAGNNLVSRQGLSILNNLDLNDWVSYDIDHYVAIAKDKSTDFSNLEQIRFSLREKMVKSKIIDSKKFVKDFVSLLNEILKDKGFL